MAPRTPAWRRPAMRRRRTTARWSATRVPMKSRTVPAPAWSPSGSPGRSPSGIPAWSPAGSPIPRWPYRHAHVWPASGGRWWPFLPNLGFPDVHHGVGVFKIFQWFGPDAVELSGYGNGTARTEHLGVQKRRAGGDETSGTGLVAARSSVGVQRQSEDVHHAAVGVVNDVDDASAPDDDDSTRAFGVGLDLAERDSFGLSPKTA